MKYILIFAIWFGLDSILFSFSTVSVLLFTATSQTLLAIGFDMSDTRKRLKRLETENPCVYCNRNVTDD